MKYDFIESVLKNLNSTPDITSSAVISTDGLPIASALQSGMDEDRIGAMAAALLSLGNRSAKEVLKGTLDNTIIHTDKGYMLLFQASEAILLTITTTHEAKLGLVLFEAKRALKELADHFE
ncbi:hypothetical protein BGI40_00345 [Snodgrassella communis]|jgi:uncharacterized protein|uniref:Roadblock/LAMTOR2 domain-containing protein n=2 Tax=Snodgrassella TaxID=1193515 RepID=A0A2N9XM32_9NEIS|nr:MULTISPECIES: roadblock/LC7 domain-containing protein [Snodgrassella]KDN11934.1 hypothetical protein SALWKB12_1856 [Snodgrassella communis]KDN14798.1 hypothetical protein SALWKB29_1257 [Snodgrassella communis]PIT07493.1 hypothetical protein BGI29_08890 [Snodgrassella communis]PIT08273.1 hypothetical protein BGI31_06985 [Snodgrassella communis]PIT20254.1 hypothetical protein BGI36_08705 [Snodgrassella communis]